MKKALPPGIGFTAETKHTLLADKQSTNPTEILAKAHARCQSSYSGRTSPALTPASRTGNENVTDCAMSFPNRINGPAETLSKVLYNRVDVPSETVLVNHWVYRPQNVFEKKSKSQNTCSYSDSEKMSRIPNIFSDSSQTGITNPVSSNESSMPSSNGNKAVRKGGSLSFDDLEDDTIYAIDCKTKVLQTVPDSIPNDLEELSWKRVVDGVVSLRYIYTSYFQQVSEEVSEVYIEHNQATDSELGDRFGATIKTIPTPGDKYCEHFFTTVERDGVAEHMQIRSGDQLVLLNGTFLPDFDHQTVLQLFSRVPVDSHTRLSLVLLRHTDKRKWIWINTSAILVPEYHSEPAVLEPHFDESHVTYHEERHLVRLKVQGTCLFIAIDERHVCLEISESGEDVAKFDICVWERCGLDSSTGRLSYSACIYRQSQKNPYQNDYLTIECGLTGGVNCLLKPEPQWFGFGLLGRTMSFKDAKLKKWLSCDVTDAGSVGTFGLTRYPYYFNTYPVEKKTRTDSTSTSAGHCHRLILNKVGTPPDGTDVDDPRRNCVSVYESESREKLDNISKTDSGYGHSTQSSYAL